MNEGQRTAIAAQQQIEQAQKGTNRELDRIVQAWGERLREDDCKWLADIWCGIDWGFDEPVVIVRRRDK